MSDYKFDLPDIGEGLSEGEIIHWHVAPGDAVKADQIMVDVQTDKAVVEIPAPVAGTVKTLGGQAGDMLPIGGMLVVIETDGAATPPASPPTPAEKKATPAVAAPAAKAPNAGRAKASPATRKLAVELGVDLTKVAGTGNRGQITKADVQSFAKGGAPVETGPIISAAPAMAVAPAIAVPVGEDRVEPLRGLRRQIAQSMTAAWREIPHILTIQEIDATDLVASRTQLKAELETQGIKLSYLPFFVKACVAALKQFPSFNASLNMEKQELVYRHRFNIGIATATPDGLIVPVIHDADRLSIPAIALEIQRLATAARSRKIKVSDISDGTFTISNFGSYGAWLGTPIIRPPEVAIAGFGAIREAVVAVDGAPAVRTLLPLVVSTDHRMNDGDQLGGFANSLASYLREPIRLLGQV